MTIDNPTEAAQEPVVSRDTAMSCLVRLGVPSIADAEIDTVAGGSALDGDTLSLSCLVELADESGLRLERARLDWQGLQTTGFDQPILVLLKNTNLVVLTGGGRNGADEVAVWDPLHHDEEILFVPRAEFERAWSGDALLVALQSSAKLEAPSSPSNVPEREITPEALGNRPPNPVGVAQEDLASTPLRRVLPPSPTSVHHARASRRSSIIRLCLASATLGVMLSLGVLLLMRPADDRAPATSTPAGEVSERSPERNGSTIAAVSPFGGRASAPRAEPAPTVAPAPLAPTLEPAPVIVPPTAATRASEPAPSAAAAPPAATPEPNSTPTLAVAEPSVADPAPAIAITPPEPKPEPGSTTAAAAQATASAGSHFAPAELTALIARGDELLGSGDVASARLYYRRAADAGDGQAAIRLGETFDPAFLEQAHLRSARGDLGAALSWYRHARDLGAPEAEVLLRTHEAK